MATNGDWYEALVEGRWRPEIETGVGEEKGVNYFYARYKQGDEKVETRSIYGPLDAESDCMERIKEGTLEGKFYPEG